MKFIKTIETLLEKAQEKGTAQINGRMSHWGGAKGELEEKYKIHITRRNISIKIREAIKMDREKLKKELESIERVFARHRDLSDMFRLEKSYKKELEKRYWELRKLLGYVKQ